jgi:hypothetical protein
MIRKFDTRLRKLETNRPAGILYVISDTPAEDPDQPPLKIIKSVGYQIRERPMTEAEWISKYCAPK